MTARMTPAAGDRGFRNMLICLVISIAVLGMLTFAISSILQQTARNSFVIAFAAYMIVTFSWLIFSWLYGKFSVGSILIDCGPHPCRSIFLFFAVLFLLMSLSEGPGASERYNLIKFPLGYMFTVYWIFLACGRLQIGENGIWQYWNLLKWHRLQSYQWHGKTNCTLILQAKTRFPLFGNGALPVPSEHRKAIDDIIKKHLTAANEQDTRW
jgi:hypothetical protein